MNRKASSRPGTKSAAIQLIEQVCAIAGNRYLIANARAQFAENGVSQAVQNHDDGPIYDWLVPIFGYQGVADSVAKSYWNSGGGVTCSQVDAGLAEASCPKLGSFWTFESCGYRKGGWACAEPDHRTDCPLPRHRLRNGRLNQTAYSLRLFLRDLCGGDLVSWIDRRLAEADLPRARDRVERLGQALIEPLKGVFGVSDKVLGMTFAELLLGADPDRERWVAAAGGLIAVDTLVHNWLHRTGILDAFGSSHLYGLHCSGPTGCAALLRGLSTQIDARRFNAAYPRHFPRFVQNAIWRFCSLGELNRCNGMRINDRAACVDAECPLGTRCARMPLFAAEPHGPFPKGRRYPSS